MHGAAGSSLITALQQNLWAPAAARPQFDLVADQPEAARAVSRSPDHRQQHRRAERRSDRGARDRRRSLPLERDVSHADAIRSAPRAPTSSAASRSISCYAQRFGQDTPIPSMQLCIENVDQSGGCGYGYSCVYTDTDQLGVADQAAADDPRSARRRSIRCSACSARIAGERASAGRRSQHPRLRRASRRSGSSGSSAPADRARLDRLPRQRPRDRAAHPGGRGAQPTAASRASCRRARAACRIHSPSTSS